MNEKIQTEDFNSLNLLIFCDPFDLKKISNNRKSKTSLHWDLFPLTSNQIFVERLKAQLESEELITFIQINSSELINTEVKSIQKQICGWSANIAEHRIWGKSIKEWFLVPEKEVSTWWFSLLSEKNTLKTNVFFKIAQILAISRVINSKNYDMCYIAISDRKMRKAVKRMCLKANIKCKTIVTDHRRILSRKEKIEKLLTENGFIGDFFYALGTLSRYVIRWIKAKYVLKSISNRKFCSKSILFVSYFPSLDINEVKRGKFINKYTGPIQNKLNELNIKPTWLLMYVPIGNFSYNDGLQFGKILSDNGESILFLEEFFTLKAICNTLFSWLVQVIKFLILNVKLNYDNFRFHLAIPESEVLLKPVWRQSFIGKIGIQGIIFYEIFKKFFSSFENFNYCIYYAEMHAWEKALNSAKALKAPKTKTVGFQHVTVSRNFFHYFYDPSETYRKNKCTDLPLPDILAGNGNLMCLFLNQSKYPNLIQLEAVRQLYLKKYMDTDFFIKQKKPVLLVAGSTNKIENVNLVYLIQAAFVQA
ncbi:MAG: hypothetical protein ACTSRA_21370, partial [Promethearchaeota archaeon]